MIKRWLPGLLAILLGAALLVAGSWKFPPVPFSVPVKLISGESAVISGFLPSDGWLGDESDLKMTFQFMPPLPTGKVQIRAEIVMPDASISPNGALSLFIDPNEPINLTWKITPLLKREIEGTLWVNSAVAGGEPQAVLAKRFQLHSMTLLGISAAWVRRIGLGLLVIAAFLLAAFSGKKTLSRQRPQKP